jgi:hypothetical protein
VGFAAAGLWLFVALTLTPPQGDCITQVALSEERTSSSTRIRLPDVPENPDCSVAMFIVKAVPIQIGGGQVSTSRTEPVPVITVERQPFAT